VGAIWQKPPRSASRRRPNTLAESKRGRQHQSTEADLDTSAAVWQSPIMA